MTKEIKKSQRLVSLDALRGFTMFWIIGGAALFQSLAKVTDSQVIGWWGTQLYHVKWNGFHFLDLIFPMFMFVSGVAMPYSLGKKLQNGISRNKLLLTVAKRALILILFGIIYNNKISFDFVNLRYASVLGQIGVAYFLAAVIYIYTNLRGQLIWTGAILIGFWAAMTFIPVPEIGAGVLTPEGNFSGYIDRLLLPGKIYRGNYDPQGILLMFSAATITIMGSVCGALLISKKYNANKKTLIMAAAGILLIGLSLIWNMWYPINKEIWSSSFNVLTIGLSLVFLSAFYFIIDVKGLSKWAFPFVVIGLNSITIYMGYHIIDFYKTSAYLLHGVMNLVGDYARVVQIIGVLALEIAVLYFLFKRKIFLRV